MAFDTLIHGQGHSQRTLPSDLEQEVGKLEDEFTVDTTKLKKIVVRFEEELREGKVGTPTFIVG
jgi:hexokinase